MDTKAQKAHSVLTQQTDFLEQAVLEWQRAVKNQDSVALFLIDIDRFDDIRRKNGCARKIIDAIDNILKRDNDYITRFSRKKIMFLTSGLTYRQSCQLAERIHQAIALLGLRQVEDDLNSALVTLSIGHLTYAPSSDSSYGILDIINNVIELCRRAKNAGGNCSKTRLHSRVLR